MRTTIFLQGLDLLLYDLILADYYYFGSLWKALIQKNLFSIHLGTYFFIFIYDMGFTNALLLMV